MSSCRFNPRAWSIRCSHTSRHSAEDIATPPTRNPPVDTFRAMAEAEGAAGALRIGLARIEGRPVAAQLWTVENGTAIIHKLAYVEDAAEHSPGSLLSAALFERIIGDGVTAIDYGTGNDRYKADWMDRSRPLEQIELYNLRTLRGLAGAAKAKIARLVRRNRVD